MKVTRFEPHGLFSLLNSNFDQLASRRPGATAGNAADWIPSVDTIENKDGFIIRADLPGVSVENIDVRMEKGILTIAGERIGDIDEGAEGPRRIERATGKFERRFSLPDSADADGISARCSNGILEIAIPKLAEIQQRRINVEAA